MTNVADLFTDLTANPQAYTYDQYKDVASGHGRVEIRHAWVIAEPAVLA